MRTAGHADGPVARGDRAVRAVRHPPLRVPRSRAQTGRTCSACGPLVPCPTSNSTDCPSSSER